MSRLERDQVYFARAQELGVELQPRPADTVVVTGLAQLTPLGGTEKTWQGLLEGRSGVRQLDVGNEWVKIGAPVDFDPAQYFDRKPLRTLSNLNAMAIVVAREAAMRAQLLADGKLRPDINRSRVALVFGSTIGSMQYIIDSYQSIHETDERGRAGRKIPVMATLQTLPEQLVGQSAIDLRISGWSGHTAEACATGLSNIVEGTRLIKGGWADIVIAGGFENPLSKHPDVTIGMLAIMQHVLSKRNYEPEKASRPFDRDRDGFVLGAGGGVVVLESLEHAQRRGAPKPLAEILGFRKSIDGTSSTEMDVGNVARTILPTLYNKQIASFHSVDAIFAHATSTQAGDPLEAAAFRRALGEEAGEIPITAIKSMIGHLEGGAGAVNAIAAINAINTGKIPAILNLENPDPKVADLFFVRGEPLEREVNTALATAYGFGGFNAVLLLGKYRG